MPELPEAEIARRQLHRWLSGKPVDRVELVDSGAIRSELSSRPSKAVEGGQSILDALATATPEEPIRHGKRIGWPWGERGLLVHLGMSGKFVKRATTEERPSYARIGWVSGEETVWFLDRRRFGCVVAVARDALDAGVRKGHGPDALDEAPDGPGLAARMTGRRAVKVALMDQAKLAGVGNIHAVEALFAAKIPPTLPCSSLTEPQWATLAAAIPVQLHKVIDAEDSGEMAYMTEGGRDNPFQVYKREDLPCYVCDTPVASITQGGRSTFYCPTCQR